MTTQDLIKHKRIRIDMQHVTVGLGWQPNEEAGKDPFDLDVTAFMLNVRQKVPSHDFMIFYGNKISPDNAVEASEDDESGEVSSGGDDETIKIDLSKIDPSIVEVAFIVTIYESEDRQQSFGQIHDSFIRIINTVNDEEIIKYQLKETFSDETAVEFGRLYRVGNSWEFEAIGEGYKKDLAFFVEKFSLSLF